MLCPVCKDEVLAGHQIEDGLNAYQCVNCCGRWVGSFHYWKWKDASGKCLIDEASDAGEADSDSKAGKLCPECGSFLRLFPVGHGVEFALDRCGNCGGMWFDKNEWETLKGQGLCEDVHKIFSQIWQNQVRSDEHQSAVTQFHKQKFGDENYQKIVEIKEWISDHPQRSELMAFLVS